ncbi:WD repeat domain-containing protein 83 [Neodiprion pinetum]|uniref:WD repeat domain-containing protein 83 n=1 Tax=Neodiprion pinetum TaxID=441929 RepID=UPI001EDEAE21|nr:WD repeat domain-containing protein 83 [Neodiprion pinetum]
MELKFINSIECKQGAVRAVRFNVDGSYCLTCGSDKKVKLWNPYRSVALKTYGGHANEVLDACASCDSSQVVSCGMDKSVIVWDVATGNPVRRLRGHAGPVTTVRFNEESTMAISGSHDNSVMCWDIRSRSQDPVQTLREAKDTVSSIRVTDHEILAASYDSRIRRYDIRIGELLVDYVGEAATCASFTRDGQCIVISCGDGVIRLMDKDTGELLGEFTGHAADDLCLESSVDCKDTHILSGSGDGKLWIWDLVTQKVVQKLSDNNLSEKIHPVVSICIHPQRNCILAASGGTILMWDTDENDSKY